MKGHATDDLIKAYSKSKIGKISNDKGNLEQIINTDEYKQDNNKSHDKLMLDDADKINLSETRPEVELCGSCLFEIF